MNNYQNKKTEEDKMSRYIFPPPQMNEEDMAKDPRSLILKHGMPDIANIVWRLLSVFMLFSTVFVLVVPWRQTSTGTGKVTAFLPQERVQNIHAPVSGRINKWHVREGTQVKVGDPIVEIIDIDPRYMERLMLEKDTVVKQYEAAKSVSTTAKINFDRQTSLFGKGISARLEMETASIAYKNAQASEAQALSNLTQVESKVSRQSTQLVKAPVNGTVVRLAQGGSSFLISAGQVIAVFVPSSAKPAVEVYIPGNDLPLVHEGRKVRLQFEGWPAVQFSGWPAVAVGTFGGVVALVDQTANAEGLFRVIITPDEGMKWPESRYIRQGTRVNGWILLNNVPLGYEIWRQFNGFPPSQELPPSSNSIDSVTELPE
ncbi:MAG: HlyD family secretion protein [Bacteriovoracaceae bacterium]